MNHWSPAAAQQRSHQLPPWSAPHWSGRWGSQQAAQLVSPQMVSATWKGAAEGERESAAAAALSPPSPLHLPFSSPARKAPPTGKPASITHSRHLFRRQMSSTEWQLFPISGKMLIPNLTRNHEKVSKQFSFAQITSFTVLEFPVIFSELSRDILDRFLLTLSKIASN